jgi:hypothetical protein
LHGLIHSPLNRAFFLRWGSPIWSSGWPFRYWKFDFQSRRLSGMSLPLLPTALEVACVVLRPADFKQVCVAVVLFELSERKAFRHRQGSPLIGFQGNLLCQHDIASDEIVLGHKTPTNSRAAGIVNLVDISSHTVPYPVSLSAVAADDVEIAVPIVLR